MSYEFAKNSKGIHLLVYNGLIFEKDWIEKDKTH